MWLRLDDVDRRRNAIGRAGHAVIFYLKLSGATHHQNWNLRVLSDRENRLGSGNRLAAEIEDNNVGITALDQVEEAGLDRPEPSCSAAAGPAAPGIDKSSLANTIVATVLI